MHTNSADLKLFEYSVAAVSPAVHREGASSQHTHDSQHAQSVAQIITSVKIAKTLQSTETEPASSH